jgi:hypothetical protein
MPDLVPLIEQNSDLKVVIDHMAVSVPGHALRCGPETSVTSPLRWRWFDLRGMRRHISSRRGRGNVGIPKGFPKSVGRVESRFHGFPCFPYSVMSMACFSPAMLDTARIGCQ